MASRWSIDRIDAPITPTGTRTGKKKSQWTTLIIVDSQAVKNICNAGLESKGYCFYKATNGIKRHLAVDTLGFPFFTHCTPANVADDVGLVEMLTLNMDYGHLYKLKISGRRGTAPGFGSSEYLYAYDTQANANRVTLL